MLDNTFNLPIHNIEAEQSVLGAIFLDPPKIDDAIELLDSKDFYVSKHQIIFDTLLKLQEQNIAIDVVTVTEELANAKNIEMVGGISYISELAGSVPTAANIQFYAKIVKDKAIERELIRKAEAIIEFTRNSDGTTEDKIEFAESQLLSISNSKNQKGFKTFKDTSFEVYQDLLELSSTDESITGLKTDFTDLDRMTAGFQGSDLIIVAARPSVGKTAFALNIASNVVKHQPKQNVAIFSLEMGAKQLVTRMLSAAGNIDANMLRTGNLDVESWNRLSHSIGIMSNYGIYIDDTPGITVQEIRSKCIKLHNTEGLGMVLIDYLQLIESKNNRENRQQVVSDISRQLKKLAKELNVPVIALSQLSRGVEQRQDKRPMMSDLRESGAIEQDADIIAFLYRDDYYDKETELKNIIEIIIAKQRNGGTGTVQLAFVKEYNKFLNIAWNQPV